jgi:phage I-like protein
MPHVRDAVVLGSFALDGGAVQLSTAGAPRSRVQVAKTGVKFKHGGKTFDITSQMIDQMVDNGKKSTTQIPLDYNHLSLGAKAPEDGVAAGWFVPEGFEGTPDKMYGVAEWTPKAAERIKNREYRYLSPVILFDAADEQGGSKGASLFSAALTIYPFLQGMEAVALSQLISDGVVLADLSIDEKRSRLQAALEKRVASGYVVDVFDDQDYLIYLDFNNGKKYKQNFKIAKDGEISWEGESEEAVTQYATLTLLPGGQRNMPDPANTPNPEVVALTASIATLTATVTELKGRIDTSEASAKAEKERADALQLSLNTTTAKAKVSTLLRQGKILKKQEEQMVALALKDPTMFDALAATFDPLVKLNEEHGTGTPAGAAGDTDEEAAAAARRNGAKVDYVKLMTDAVEKYIADNGGKEKVKYGEAFRAVGEANPQLANDYRASFQAVEDE